jgi:hypothetical protein
LETLGDLFSNTFLGVAKLHVLGGKNRILSEMLLAFSKMRKKSSPTTSNPCSCS